MKTDNPVMFGLWQACLFTPQITCAHFTQACSDDLKQGERYENKLKEQLMLSTVACSVYAENLFTFQFSYAGYLIKIKTNIWWVHFEKGDGGK